MGPWMKVKLAQVCSSISDGDHLPPPKCESGIPFVTISDIKNNKFDLSNTRFVPKAYFDTIDEKRRIRKGDVLYSVVGSYGIPVYADTDLEIAFQRHIAILKPSSTVDSRFLYYSVLSPAFYNAADNVAIGAAQKTITLSALRNLEIPLPPLLVQRRIADVLSAYDDLIENNRRRIAILEETARLAYRKWFGGVEQCRTATLGDVLETIESGSRPRGGAVNDGVPSIGAEKIESIGVYDYSSEKFVSREYYDKMRRGKIRSGDVLLYKDGAYTGKVSMALNGFPHAEAAVNEHVFILRTRNLHAQCFLYCFLRQQEIYDKINTIASAKACQPGLNQSDVLNLEIEVPTDDEIGRFENRVIPLFDEIVNFAKQNAALVTARDMLLPRLMKGGAA